MARHNKVVWVKVFAIVFVCAVGTASVFLLVFSNNDKVWWKSRGFRAAIENGEVAILVWNRDSEPLNSQDFCRWLNRAMSTQVLVLRDAPIDDSSMHCIAKVSQLIYLDVSGTNVTDTGLSQLTSLPLVTLYMEDTTISDDAVNILRKFKHLRYLRIGNTLISDKGVEELRMLLPECDIWH